MTNFADDANPKSYEDYYCSAALAEGRNKDLFCLIGLNIFVSITAFLGNALILVALHKESSLHPPSKHLFRNLAAADLAVGIIAQPFHVVYFICLSLEKWNICRLAFITSHVTSYILCGVSLLTLTAISVDRVLALLLGLRYRKVVTIKRICVIRFVFWLVSTIGSTVYFWSHRVTIWLGFGASLLCVVTSVICYAKIFFTLRHNQVQAQGQQTRNVLPNRSATRYKRTVCSALWVQLALVVCYLPYTIMQIVVFRRGLSPFLFFARSFTATLVCLSSSLNPILYCWKIREVRQAVKDIVRGLFCS